MTEAELRKEAPSQGTATATKVSAKWNFTGNEGEKRCHPELVEGSLAILPGGACYGRIVRDPSTAPGQARLAQDDGTFL